MGIQGSHAVEIPWYEVRIPKDAGYRRVADSFLNDYCLAHRAAAIEVTRIHHNDADGSDSYFLPPEAAAFYFLSPYASALADWLIKIELARPLPETPDVTGYHPLPC
jgi:hypothetical protein